jgi:hypothetical protein
VRKYAPSHRLDVAQAHVTLRQYPEAVSVLQQLLQRHSRSAADAGIRPGAARGHHGSRCRPVTGRKARGSTTGPISRPPTRPARRRPGRELAADPPARMHSPPRRRTHPPGGSRHKPDWDLPGGVAEANEPPRDTARRTAGRTGPRRPARALLCVDGRHRPSPGTTGAGHRAGSMPAGRASLLSTRAVGLRAEHILSRRTCGWRKRQSWP